jgi:hypothetical protein
MGTCPSLEDNRRWRLFSVLGGGLHGADSAQTDAAAKTGEKGAEYSGAVEVAPGVWVYQITKNGPTLQLTLQGTKYSKDDDHNKT